MPRLRAGHLGIPLACVLLASGCGGDDDPVAATASATASLPTASPSASVVSPRAPELTDVPLEGFTRTGISFGNLGYDVSAAHVTNQSLRSYADGGEPEVTTTSHLILDLTVRNTTARQIESDADAIAVEIGDTRLSVAGDFLTDATGFIRPATEVEDFLAFEVPPGTDLLGAELVLGVAPDRQERQALVGTPVLEAGASPYELAGSATGTGPTNGGTILFEALDAMVSKDLPHGQTTSPTGERADIGEIFFQVHVRATKTEGRGNDLLGVNAFRLLVDGVPRAPFDVATAATGSTPSPTAMPGVAVDAWVLFAVEVGAEAYVLQVGDLDDGPGSLPVEVRSLD